MVLLNSDTLELLAKNRCYVFFRDGSWRTCTDQQWRLERLYEREDLEPGYGCFWAGGPELQKLLERLGARDERVRDEVIKSAVMAERERCAKLVERRFADIDGYPSDPDIIAEIAAMIRKAP